MAVQDKLFLRDYRKSIEIGAFQEERQIRQDIVLNIEVTLCDHPPFQDDAVDEILSYDVLVNAVENCLATRRYNLLEALAEDIAARVLLESAVQTVEIEIQKLGRVDGALGVRISRHEKSRADDFLADQLPLFVIYADAKFKAPSMPIVLLPMQDFSEIRDFHEQQILRHQLDAQGWALGAQLALPVVKSNTESESLIARGQGFVRIFGDAIFSTAPRIETFTPENLTAWIKAQIHPSEITIIKE